MTEYGRIAVLAIAVSLAFAASADGPSSPASMQDVMSMDASYAQRLARDGEARLREEMVRDAALAMGTQSGYAERAGEIRELVDRRAQQLDRIFVFGPLCRDGRVLAPVVELVEDVLAVEDNGTAMRETARVLRVVQAARLVTVPPTWRDWLTIRPPELSPPDAIAFPASARERSIWQAAIKESWGVGRHHADAVYQTQLEELKQAYEGMLRYHELLAQGVIAPAEVGRADLGIVRQDAELRIGDTIYTVRAPAKFQESTQWKATATPRDSQESLAQ